MIISRTPLRMSFVGGGSDLPAFYRRNGGAVVSATIDKYIYVTVSQKFDHALRVSYSSTEEVEYAEQVKHPLVREALGLLHIKGGVEITSVADIPSHGTGLGSSSSFTVGLLHALHAYQGRYTSAETLASQACEIEIERCGEPIGKQDQYAAAFGGLNFIEFNADESVMIEPIICSRGTISHLQDELIMFYTGMTRSASKLLRRQSKVAGTDAKSKAILKNMVKLAYDLRSEFRKNNISSFGDILHEGWLLKKRVVNGISNSKIDFWYKRACEAGARGGKILGAGNGGFLVFAASQDRHDNIRKALAELREVSFRFEPQGSRIIFVH